MNKILVHAPLGACLAVFLLAGAPTVARAQEKITITVCLKSDMGKVPPRPPVQFHLITSQGEFVRNSDDKGCATWEILPVDTFTIYLWYGDLFLDRTPPIDGRGSSTTPLNFDKMLAGKNDPQRLVSFRAYLDSLKGHDSVDPRAVKLLTSEKARIQLNQLMNADPDLKTEEKEAILKQLDNIKNKAR